jgi:hypothetical protein
VKIIYFAATVSNFLHFLSRGSAFREKGEGAKADADFAEARRLHPMIPEFKPEEKPCPSGKAA